MTKVLIVPGLNGSGFNHWQTAWEQVRRDCIRVEQRSWSDPEPDEWTARLDQAVRAAGEPVVFAAHSLGCLAIAHAASVHGNWDGWVRGALLVAPCDPSREGAPPAVARFAPARRPLPFASTVVASRNDPYASIERSRCFADVWGSSLIDVGMAGHINAASGLGDWRAGQVALEALIRGPSVATALKLAAVRAERLDRQGYIRACGERWAI